MKTYDKRIGFLVSYQTLIPHGGIGQFTKSFCKLMYEHNIKVDIIIDKEPEDDDFIKELKKTANIIAPDKVLPYTQHNKMYKHKDTYNYARMENFNTSIHKALMKNMYNAIVCNTYEAIQVASVFGINDVIQVIAYTHLESQIFKNTSNPFLDSTNEMMRKQLELSDLYVGTQSKFNQVNIDNSWHLPIPITEPELLKEYDKPREGVLFIGRWEPGKNPELYCDLIEQTKLPAKIMTNESGAKTFIKEFKKRGITGYQIGISIIGQKKVDFITSAKVAFNPSTVESYGMAFHEQHIQMPTFVLTGQRWTNSFNKDFFFTTTKQTMVKDVLDIYNSDVANNWYISGSLKNAQDQEASVFHKWNECFNDFKCKQSSSNTANICEEKTVVYNKYVSNIGRELIEDVLPIYTNKHKFRLIYTDDNTYLTKDPSFEPVEEITGLSLFEGL